MKLIAYEEARSIALAILHNAGVPPSHARLQADLLLEAELRGRASHGLLRLQRIAERIQNGVADPVTRGEHQWRGGFLQTEGCNGLGPVVACAALDLLIERIQDTGIAVAAIRNNNHLGMLAWYADRVARQGFILIALCNSEALVHPWGGRRAMLGTNPIAIGVPTATDPFVMDMATSLVSMGQIHDHANRKVPLPPGWALDANGDPTTDPVAAKSGAIAPFGDAKGYALGLAFEVLIGALTASAVGPDVHGTLDSDQLCNKGDVFIVINPNTGTSTAGRITAYLDAIRLSGGDNATQAIVPGDRASACRQERLRTGIPIDPELWEKLQKLAGQRAS